MIRKFFLADDDADDTSLFSEALRDIDASIQFHSASNGRELIHKLQQSNERPHVIFLDINMPEMNGWEALQSLKREEALKTIPVIMYSTASSIIEGKKAIKSGAMAFYEKPPDFLKLKDFLEMISASSKDELKSTLKKISSSKVHKVYSE